LDVVGDATCRCDHFGEVAFNGGISYVDCCAPKVPATWPKVWAHYAAMFNCDMIVAAPQKSTYEKPTFNFAMRIDVDQF
jgi:hypothetical protein